MTSRRGFLGSIATFAAACTLDPELALFVPGKKLISIPEPPKAERLYPVRTVVVSGATDPAVNGTWLLVNGVPVERLDDVTADLHTCVPYCF